jgi:hypothetical protein
MFGPLGPLLFERLQLGNSHATPLRRLDQPVTPKGFVHRPARSDHIADQRVQRPRPSSLSLSLGLFRPPRHQREGGEHFPMSRLTSTASFQKEAGVVARCADG